MDGKTHLKLGITSSVAASIFLSKYLNNKELLYYGLAIAPVVSILTSQLPDIDSKRSKISQHIPIVNWIKSNTFFTIAIILLFISFIISNLSVIPINEKIAFFLEPILNLLGNDKVIYYIEVAHNTSIVMLMIYFFTKIFLKHRKLTHCLICCICVSIASFYFYYIISIPITFSLGLGLSVGYISHIFYDCLTTRGCPLLYPIIKKPIRGPLRSEKHGNLAIFISLIFIALSIYYYIKI